MVQEANKQLPKLKAMIGHYDVTEHIAAMYDALITSMDWGSGFLSIDEQKSILIVGHLLGFDVPKDIDLDHRGDWGIERPLIPPYIEDVEVRMRRWGDYKAQTDEWKAQVLASIHAQAEECFNEEACEAVGIELLAKVTTPKK